MTWHPISWVREVFACVSVPVQGSHRQATLQMGWPWGTLRILSSLHARAGGQGGAGAQGAVRLPSSVRQTSL